MIEPCWLNGIVILFRHRQDQDPAWMGYADIERISWKDPKEARIVLRGILPMARDLLKVTDGDTLELLHRECGSPYAYESEDVIMSFSNCIIRRRWIPSLAFDMQAGYGKPITIYVSLECELRIDVQRKEG